MKKKVQREAWARAQTMHRDDQKEIERLNNLLESSSRESQRLNAELIDLRRTDRTVTVIAKVDGQQFGAALPDKPESISWWVAHVLVPRVGRGPANRCELQILDQ